MKFWDTSAIVPLCVREPRSPAVRSILAKDKAIVVWWATRIDLISALMRRSRQGGISRTGEKQARRLLEMLAKTWVEVQPAHSLRSTAERLLAVHSLRAADGFQLAAA